MVKGQLDPDWKEWFEGLKILEENYTILYGDVLDDTIVHGTLAKIRDLNLKLVSVDIIDDDSGKSFGEIHSV